jgi:hypothetical protein
LNETCETRNAEAVRLLEIAVLPGAGWRRIFVVPTLAIIQSFRAQYDSSTYRFRFLKPEFFGSIQTMLKLKPLILPEIQPKGGARLERPLFLCTVSDTLPAIPEHTERMRGRTLRCKEAVGSAGRNAEYQMWIRFPVVSGIGWPLSSEVNAKSKITAFRKTTPKSLSLMVTRIDCAKSSGIFATVLTAFLRSPEAAFRQHSP